jgi:hypothetical protein
MGGLAKVENGISKHIGPSIGEVMHEKSINQVRAISRLLSQLYTDTHQHAGWPKHKMHVQPG